jgi:hypothetical protein
MPEGLGEHWQHGDREQYSNEWQRPGKVGCPLHRSGRSRSHDTWRGQDQGKTGNDMFHLRLSEDGNERRKQPIAGSLVAPRHPGK